jgi:hypothetical protein
MTLTQEYLARIRQVAQDKQTPKTRQVETRVKKNGSRNIHEERRRKEEEVKVVTTLT